MASTPRSHRFVLGSRLELDETRTVEFKEVKGSNPLGAIPNAADENAVAFLNSEGGVIYWGIQNGTGTIVGVTLLPKQRDDLRQAVLNKLLGIQPEIDPTRFRFEIHPVEGSSSDSNLVVVELAVPCVKNVDPFYTAGGEVFVRLDGVKKSLTGPQLTAWIKHRNFSTTPGTGTVRDAKLLASVGRIRSVFAAHGMEPTHWARFLKIRKAPFSINLTDIQNDAALLSWLDEDKIAWIAETFLLRREWIDGEDSEIHRRYYFDKAPEDFFRVVSENVDGLIWEDVHDSPAAFFIRRGRGKEWAGKGEYDVFVVVRVPVAQLSDNLYVYKYVSDFAPYSWEYLRTNIQLRAWARLLFVSKSIQCFGCDISLEDGDRLFNNEVFLHQIIKTRAIVRTHIWHPEDHALSPRESLVAKDVDTLPAVIEFLRIHNLPFEETRLGQKS